MMIKLAYKPVGAVMGMLGAMAAGIVIRKTWHAITGEDQTPDAKDPNVPWLHVLSAAAIEGAVYAVVKAAVDRGGAAGVNRLTPHEDRLSSMS
ncbi:MAG TPA: DUF4235 domain-containing protein [Candidatus Stackebrandtia faecavium]|nr:DUF4235 domain-containing protein [Candidatus Stackebrandtia faecavium]